MNTSPYLVEALAAAHRSELRRAAAHGRLVRVLKARARVEQRVARAAREAVAGGLVQPVGPLTEPTPGAPASAA